MGLDLTLQLADHVWRHRAFIQGLHGLAFARWQDVIDGRWNFPIRYDYHENKDETGRRYDRADLRSRPNWDLP